jgi:tetratricopeptide (TPR) repeat protein
MKRRSGRRSRGTLSPAEILLSEGRAIEYPGLNVRRSGERPKITEQQRRRAIAKYTQALALEPGLVDAYISRSHSRRGLGDQAGARRDAQAAYRLRPDDPTDYLQICFGFPPSMQRRILREGIARATPGSWQHRHIGLYSAHTYWYERRFDLMLAATRRLIRLFESLGKGRSTAYLHHQAGTALMAMGRFGPAERQIRAAFNDSEGAGTLARIAVVQCRLYRGDPRGAIQALEEAKDALDPFEVELTRMYLLAQLPDAIVVPKALARRLLHQRDEGVLGYMGAVVLLLGLGRRDVAAPRLRAFVERCESNPSEWGVTLRWEIARAKQLLRNIGLRKGGS